MTLKAFLTSIADSIRAKTGTTDEIPASEFADRISQIETGIDTSDATATTADILDGKTAYVGNKLVTGTMQTVEQATPSISVGTDGLITVSASQIEGYVAAGTKTSTSQLPTKAATIWTPKTTNQTISANTYLTGAQTIEGDSNLIASNIKSGVSIFGVAGTYSASAPVCDVEFYIDTNAVAIIMTDLETTKFTAKTATTVTLKCTAGGCATVYSRNEDSLVGSLTNATLVNYYDSDYCHFAFKIAPDATTAFIEVWA